MQQWGNFRAIKKIGHGGMANVYLVEDMKTGLHYALKELIPQSNEPQRLKRFEQEVKIYSKISNPAVAVFKGAKFINVPKPYMVMEYVDGTMLKDYISMNGGSLSPSHAANLASRLARGFSAIHAVHVIHRDIKSSNIMINKEGDIKIIDFGIALDPQAERLTTEGKIIGSAHYLAPELLRKEPPTVKSDIYALGVILFEMLAGKPPFNGANALEIVNEHQNKRIPSLIAINNQITQSLQNIVVKAMAKDPKDRFSSMEEFARSLDNYLRSESSSGARVESLDGKKKASFFGRLFKK
ncbi:serine/threonine-protein kinase [Mycoplasma testudineum]|uniref:non-specific serine/threonine protein kinase n=1 Tax=Mycoplasma testudineum TaxID=244584 RepID=A0A4R6ICX6_9MOLU|nr:serine/threonine-protein kinase [Mycoplasma testudineum]OYD26604.1 serine/threonine protein kinase [Mycoplasma testudineum]TDO19437.1 serine/threonine-protein kinase [Mycoplasma testudineum]